jgi:hypothetical protein
MVMGAELRDWVSIDNLCKKKMVKIFFTEGQ